MANLTDTEEKWGPEKWGKMGSDTIFTGITPTQSTPSLACPLLLTLRADRSIPQPAV